MLRETKPDIPWYEPGGLEEMFFCLFQCEREGKCPEDNVRDHRVPRVRKILADERLQGCFGGASYEETEHMPYTELRARAIILKRQILKWMDGRVYDRREQRKARKGVKQFVEVEPAKKKLEQRSLTPSVRELRSMHSKLRSFLALESEGCESSRQTFDLLYNEAWYIVSDARFRKYRWHTASTVTLCLELSERAEVAMESVAVTLKNLEAKRKKRTKGISNAKTERAPVKGKTSNWARRPGENPVRARSVRERRLRSAEEHS
jgi:hypothetical protein